MFRIQHIAVAALVAAGSMAAHAADFYVGGSVGTSKAHYEDVPSGFTLDDTDTGFKLYGGAQFTPNFSLEGGYVDLGKATLSTSGVTGSQSGTGFFLDAVGEFPLSKGFSLFGKLGVFHGESKIEALGLSDKDSGTDVKFGFGGSYAINKNLSVRAEIERFRFNVFDDKGDVDLLSIGLNYRF